jgi:hypothetical protein
VTLADTANVLQFAGRIRNSLTARAEHMAKKFLRQRNRVGASTVLGHKQPTTQALSDTVIAIAYVRLCHHPELSVQVFEHCFLNGCVAPEFRAENIARKRNASPPN